MKNEIRVSYDLESSSIKIMMDDYKGNHLISVLAVALGSAIAKETKPECIEKVRAHAIKGIDMVLAICDEMEFSPIEEPIDNSIN